MLEMEPGTGRDREPWWLCVRCWSESLKPIVVER